MSGDADAIARVRTQDTRDLERLIVELQRDGSVVRTRSQIVLSRLVVRGAANSVAVATPHRPGLRRDDGGV